MAWKPFLVAFDQHFSCLPTSGESGQFLCALADLKGTAFPLYPAKNGITCGENDPIGYGPFRFKTSTTMPLYKRNVAFVTFVDPVVGPVLKCIAVRPIEAGDRVSLLLAISVQSVFLVQEKTVYSSKNGLIYSCVAIFWKRKGSLRDSRECPTPSYLSKR